MKDDSIRPEMDYSEHGQQPVYVTHAPGRGAMWSSITRAVVSFTLLAVLLLAFGVAIAGWFIGTRVRDDLAAEIDRTPVQAQIVVAYRDALTQRTQQMADDRVVVTPPDRNDLYDEVMRERRGRGGILSGAGGDDLQAQVDLLQRDNADLRWVNAQLRQAVATNRNPPAPRRNEAP
jgi:hypothetical protein